MSKMKRLCLIGGPGVGKGSFSKIICSKFNLAHISLGDIIRKEIETKTDIGTLVQVHVRSGNLVPDDIAFDIVMKSCKGIINDKKFSGYIIDGFPRTLHQAKLVTNNNLISSAVNITLDKNLTIRKLLGRRVCKTCSNDFNLANIIDDGYYMPAILPNPKTCRFGEKCNPVLEIRFDDNEETIRTRFEVFDQEIHPILEHFEALNILKSFEVRRGISDADSLMKAILG